MCKLITAIAIKNPQLLDQVLEANELDLSLEADGFSYASDTGTFRGLEYKFQKVEYKKWVVVHTRTATNGTVNADNTHCWKHNEYTFAHNGTIASLASSVKKSDSRMFFDNLVTKPITAEWLVDRIEHFGLWGVVSLVDTAKNVVHIGAKAKVANLYTDDANSFLLASSYEIANKHHPSLDAYGLEFSTIGNADPLLTAHTTLYNEVVTFDLTTGQIVGTVPIRITTAKNYGKFDTKGNYTPYAVKTKDNYLLDAELDDAQAYESYCEQRAGLYNID